MRGLKPFDFIALLLALGLVAAASLAAVNRAAHGSEVQITASGGRWIYPLSQDRNITVEGPLGTTTIEISGGRVRVLDSPCPHKDCIRKGAIDAAGQWNACLPNRVFVRIQGRNEGGVDAYSH